jgi:cytosine/adenosine deaminase-related metal-dependent hydrolase
MTRQETILGNARIVLADRVIERGWVAFADGRIAEFGEGSAPSGSEDAGGDLIMPGLIELHTDHLEMHYVPRPKGVLGSDRGGGFLRRTVGHLGHHHRAGFAAGLARGWRRGG